jgi:hypothetical protein
MKLLGHKHINAPKGNLVKYHHYFDCFHFYRYISPEWTWDNQQRLLNNKYGQGDKETIATNLITGETRPLGEVNWIVISKEEYQQILEDYDI